MQHLSVLVGRFEPCLLCRKTPRRRPIHLLPAQPSTQGTLQGPQTHIEGGSSSGVYFLTRQKTKGAGLQNVHPTPRRICRTFLNSCISLFWLHCRSRCSQHVPYTLRVRVRCSYLLLVGRESHVAEPVVLSGKKRSRAADDVADLYARTRWLHAAHTYDTYDGGNGRGHTSGDWGGQRLANTAMVCRTCTYRNSVRSRPVAEGTVAVL